MNKQDQNNSILEHCSECRRLGKNLRFFPRLDLHHPLKDVLKTYRISIRSLYDYSLPKWPEKPSLKRFYKMLNGEETMPAILEIWLWRYLHERYGCWWIIVGGGSAPDHRDHHFITADGWRLEKVRKYKGFWT